MGQNPKHGNVTHNNLSASARPSSSSSLLLTSNNDDYDHNESSLVTTSFKEGSFTSFRNRRHDHHPFQQRSSFHSDSVFYLVSYNPSLFSDGINPGIGVSRVVDENGKVLLQDDSSAAFNSGYQDRTFDKNAIKLVLKKVTIVKVCSGRLHTHLLTHDGKILSFGSNNHGQLACGRNGSIPTSYGVVPAVGEIAKTFVVDGAGGGYHSVFLTIDHRVFTVGSNGCCQCGTNEFTQTHTAYEVTSSKFNDRKVIACSAGDSHTCFLTLCGHVYFAGSNSNGCCVGLKSSDRPVLLVHDLLRNQFPIHVTCGYDNTVIVCRSGTVFGAGCNSCGQMAVKEQEHQNFSELRPLFFGKSDVLWASTGYFCSVLKSMNGDYFYAPAQQRDMACLCDIFPKQHSILSILAGDYVLWVTNEMQEKEEKCGKIYGYTGGMPTDITGEFCLTDSSSTSGVGISAQRDLFIIYFTGVPTHVVVARHFCHLHQIVGHMCGKGSYYSEDMNLFSDITIIM
ncbi:hypothetical protein FDP41_007643 [Naegleria fowleri]|uniref:Uncharacterized protein n=1 Tax=Naegleria fowleri TaxID=5763 RepID=A0A6A5CE21_NAEFO|nr:uncharacterized protein FDP41_007643 [Naegleria fowleri]KAF0983728.1 hypothetical protein FDP41_007643 [Naegleria fowleri]